MTQREEIIAYATHTYDAVPDQPFPRDLDSTVLRHVGTRKWYGLFMKIERSKLGSFDDEIVDILNVKCDPVLGGSVIDGVHIFPGWHMNHKSWLTIVLDGELPNDRITSLLDLSFDLTSAGDHSKSAERTYAKDWIIPSNYAHFSVPDWFAANETVTWHMQKNMRVGDRVFIYIGVPFSAILYQCRIEETGLRVHCDGSTDSRPIMLLKKVKAYLPEELNRPVLREFGVTNVRGARSMPESLSRYIAVLDQEK
ncbi:MAG: MmcQ/YjbR family DNA-binding protein [Lachnospiraceae bacterium]|nr:MmcQ/YjbR family DNA-binding protein [Lachnospiraceae bacterium]